MEFAECTFQCNSVSTFFAWVLNGPLKEERSRRSSGATVKKFRHFSRLEHEGNGRDGKREAFKNRLKIDLGQTNKRAGEGKDGKVKLPIVFWAGAMVQWLWEETHVQEVLGVNPGHGYWMGIFHKY